MPKTASIPFSLPGVLLKAFKINDRINECAHDAHHRGQVAMPARQVGHGLPQKAMFGMWEWGTR